MLTETDREQFKKNFRAGWELNRKILPWVIEKIIDSLPTQAEPTFKYQQPKSCIGCTYVTESLVCSIPEKNCVRKDIKQDYYQRGD